MALYVLCVSVFVFLFRLFNLLSSRRRKVDLDPLRLPPIKRLVCINGIADSNPNHDMMEKVYGYSGAGIFGYSHLYGGYAGGQAEFVRVPYADVGPTKVDSGLTDEQVLFLTDIFPGIRRPKTETFREEKPLLFWGGWTAALKSS